MDSESHDLQIIAKSDWGYDRDAAYRIRRYADGTVVETFMQYDGSSEHNFYEIRTDAQGQMTAFLHTWDPTTRGYTRAPADLAAATQDRRDNLATIESDDSLGAHTNMLHGRLHQGILRQAINTLGRSGTTLDGAVFNSGESVPAQQPNRDGLDAIENAVTGRWL